MRVMAQNQVLLSDQNGPPGAFISAGGPPSVIDLAPVFAAKQAAALNLLLADASPEEIIAAALGAVDHGRFAIISSFGTESAVLLAAAASVDRRFPILARRYRLSVS